MRRWHARLAEWTWENPVVRRERARRPARGGWLREGLPWAGLLLVLAFYAAFGWWLSSPGVDPWQGRTFLLGACALYLLGVSLAVPGPAAAAISGERERETLQSLLLTALRPSQ